jgi:hypothetical protein
MRKDLALGQASGLSENASTRNTHPYFGRFYSGRGYEST